MIISLTFINQEEVLFIMSFRNSKTRVSPKGELAGFIAIERPTVKYDADGIYMFKLNISNEADIETFSGMIDRLAQLSLQSGEYADSDKGELMPSYDITEEGILSVKFKQNASIPTQKGGRVPYKIKLYDSNNKFIKYSEEKVLGIRAGTICKVLFSTYHWSSAQKYGVRLQPIGIKILALQSYISTHDPEDDLGHLLGEEEGEYHHTPVDFTTGPARRASIDWDYKYEE